MNRAPQASHLGRVSPKAITATPQDTRVTSIIWAVYQPGEQKMPELSQPSTIITDMAKPLKATHRPMGRPPNSGIYGTAGARVVSVRLHPDDYQRIVAWGRTRGLRPSQAARRLITDQLT